MTTKNTTYNNWLQKVNKISNYMLKFDPNTFFGGLIVAKLHSESSKNNAMIPFYIVGIEKDKIAAINLKNLTPEQQKYVIFASTLEIKSKKQAILDFLSFKNNKKNIKILNFKDLKGYFPIDQKDFYFFYEFLNKKDTSWAAKQV